MLDISNVSVDTFCIGPFAELRINSDGSLNFCHAADQSQISQYDNIMKTRLDDYFHGQTVRAAREKMQHGQALKRCRNCYATEQSGCISFRQRRNLQAAVFPGPDMPQSMSESRFLNNFNRHSKPRFYHISFSNLCNMACMMCYPKNSTKLQVMLQHTQKTQSPMFGLLDWTAGPAWHDFCQHLLDNNDIMCLHVMGGEPMYHKKFKEMLELLCLNQHTDFHFSVVTNGTIYDQHLIDMLTNFRSVQIEISIEAIDTTNDYIRHGHSVESIKSNIQKFLRNKSDRCEVVLRTVPQALSAPSYHKILQYCLDNDIIVDSNVMFEPDFLCSNVLPDDIKDTVKSLLQYYITKDPPTLQDINLRNTDRVRASISNNAKFFISQMDQPVADIEKKRRKLAEYCKSWDQYRRFRIDQYMPELADFLYRYGYDQE
jgi:organic radical activating enzyme